MGLKKSKKNLANDLNKDISTKNLFLLEVYKCVSEGDFDATVRPQRIYLLGRKGVEYNWQYTDIFTGTVYDDCFFAEQSKLGKVIVHVVSPIISDKGTITEEEAKKMLEEYNFYSIGKDYKENTKKFIMIAQKLNRQADINPEKAEEFATLFFDAILKDKKLSELLESKKGDA